MRTKKEPELNELIGALVARTKPTPNGYRRDLSRGLVLKYYPPGRGELIHVLTAARHGSEPSEKELAIVKDNLLTALRKAGRRWDQVAIGEVEQKGNWAAARVTWIEPEQLELWGRWHNG